MFGFFNKYPYADIHSLNLDWILEKTKEALKRSTGAEKTAAEAAANVQAATAAAEEAKNAADNANNAANEAKTAADEAKQSGANAENAAGEAVNKSNEADAKADNALAMAGEAIASAASANNTAAEAVRIAQEAQAGEIAPGTIGEDKLTEELQAKINAGSTPEAGSITETQLDSELQNKINNPLGGIADGTIPAAKLDIETQSKINNPLESIADGTMPESKLDNATQGKIDNPLNSIVDGTIPEAKLEQMLQDKINSSGGGMEIIKVLHREDFTQDSNRNLTYTFDNVEIKPNEIFLALGYLAFNIPGTSYGFGSVALTGVFHNNYSVTAVDTALVSMPGIVSSTRGTGLTGSCYVAVRGSVIDSSGEKIAQVKTLTIMSPSLEGSGSVYNSGWASPDGVLIAKIK